MFGLEFGDMVLFLTAVTGKMMAKLKSKWSYGIFLGVRPRSNEIRLAPKKT